MNKFIIWGMGGRGKQMLVEIGKAHIEAVVDSNPEIQGTIFAGFKILSPEEFIQNNYLKYPIFVTPKDYEVEIIEKLKSMGATLVFSHIEEFCQLEYFVKQVTFKKIIKNDAKNHYILGFNSTSLALCQYLKLIGKQAFVIASNITNQIENALKENGYCVLRGIPCVEDTSAYYLANENEKELCNKKIEGLIDISKPETMIELTHNRSIEKFKGILKGKRCFLIATGPSLKIQDLNTLHANNEICFSVNAITKVANKTQWRPNYYAISDPLCRYYHANDEFAFGKEYNFIADISWTFEEDFVHENFLKWHFMRQEICDDGSKIVKISDNFSKGAYFGCTVMYEACVQLALYMEAKEIYLLGADTPNGGETTHFYDVNNPNRIKSSIGMSYKRIVQAYESAKKLAEKKGIKIYNATRGGALEVFERVNFDTLF